MSSLTYLSKSTKLLYDLKQGCATVFYKGLDGKHLGFRGPYSPIVVTQLPLSSHSVPIKLYGVENLNAVYISMYHDIVVFF